MRILSTLDREQLKPNVSVALHRHSHSVVDILPPESDSTIQVREGLCTGLYGFVSYREISMRLGTGTHKPNIPARLTLSPPPLTPNTPPQLMSEKPDVSYNDIGGMDIQKQEVKEVRIC